MRSIVEFETSDGRVGISETYGDEPMLRVLEQARALVVGLSPFALNVMEERVREAVRPTPGAIEFELAPGSHSAKNAAKVTSTFEVAMLDLQGQIVGAPVVDLLGGRVRDAVPYSAYLFFKYAEHVDRPYAPDAWGEGISPQQIVEQATQDAPRLRLPEHQAQGRRVRAGARDRLHAGAARGLPRRAAAARPERQLVARNQHRRRAGARPDPRVLRRPVPRPRRHGRAGEAHELPLATNMVITTLDEFRRGVGMGAAKVILSDHHYWGGLRVTQTLARMCRLWGLGMSMHSNSHLGISLMAMTHVAASIPNLTYACDTHYPWQEEEVVEGGRIVFENGSVKVPDAPGLGVTLDRAALAQLHEQYLSCGVRNRNDLAQMKKYDPSFTGRQPRF